MAEDNKYQSKTIEELKEKESSLTENKFATFTQDLAKDLEQIQEKKNNENKPIRENYFREKFYKTLETLGIEKHETHDCRKTLATFLSKYQLNEVQITDILGHENINTTNDYYIKVDEQELKKSINKIDFLKDVI